MTNEAAKRLRDRMGIYPKDEDMDLLLADALAAERKAGWTEGWADGIREKRAEHIESPIRKATVERIRAALLAGAVIPSSIEDPYLRGIAEARNHLLRILDAEAAR